MRRNYRRDNASKMMWSRACSRRRPALWLGVALAVLLLPFAVHAQSGSWIRPHDAKGALVWGRTDGVVFGLPSSGGMRGPRGLIRVGLFNRESGIPDLVNFIAIEPVIFGPGPRLGRQGFSELEASQLDPGKHGKRLWVYVPEGESADAAAAGTLTTFPARPQPIQVLSVRIEVEPFSSNHAHVYVVARIESNRPDEVAFSVFRYKDSAPVKELTLTATMGSYERLRKLWLAGKIIDSRALYRGYAGGGFVERESYPIEDMLRAWNGDAIVLATTNERNPSAVRVPIGHWTYPLPRLTQYWRVPHHDIQPDLRVRVNGRRTYWQSNYPIPGGITFENFEVRERYVRGQTFVFGLTRKEPSQMQLPDLPQLPTLH